MTQAVLTKSSRSHPKMTFEEFLDYGEEGQRFEWVEGEVFEMLSPAMVHQLLEAFLCAILTACVRAKGLGTVLPEFTMHLPLRPSGRDPDIIFISTSQSHRLRKNYLDGAADLVIELISPGTERQDRSTKFLEYQQAGVQEYWIIDGVRRVAQFYQLDAEGYYQQILPDEKGVYYCTAITDLWLNVEWLWQPYPSEFFIYKEWGLI